MSYEFGSYNSGYFHSQIDQAAEDLRGGRDALTRVWATFFAEFGPVALAICASEAHDSGPERPILATIAKLPALKAALDDVERHVDAYRRVADAAIRAHVNGSGA